jgi:hypothetical protein
MYIIGRVEHRGNYPRGIVSTVFRKHGKTADDACERLAGNGKSPFRHGQFARRSSVAWNVLETIPGG